MNLFTLGLYIHSVIAEAV